MNGFEDGQLGALLTQVGIPGVTAWALVGLLKQRFMTNIWEPMHLPARARPLVGAGVAFTLALIVGYVIDGNLVLVDALVAILAAIAVSGGQEVQQAVRGTGGDNE